MEMQYYQSLRRASREDFYEAINSPDHELYEVLWDLFETVVIEPAEVFDSDFGKRNEYRSSIGSVVTLEFFPSASYFRARSENNPYLDGGEPAGIHLRLSVHPEMSCLFSVALRVWGRAERNAFGQLWKRHRTFLARVIENAKPMVRKRITFPAMDHASSLSEMMDNYFAVRDAENFLELRYPFAQFDESDAAQNFMIYMSLIYHLIRDRCQNRRSRTARHRATLCEFFAGRLPDLQPPLPCVELAIATDKE